MWTARSCIPPPLNLNLLSCFVNVPLFFLCFCSQQGLRHSSNSIAAFSRLFPSKTTCTFLIFLLSASTTAIIHPFLHLSPLSVCRVLSDLVILVHFVLACFVCLRAFLILLLVTWLLSTRSDHFHPSLSFLLIISSMSLQSGPNSFTPEYIYAWYKKRRSQVCFIPGV